MNSLIKKGMLAVTLGASTLVAIAPAEARHRDRYYGHHGSRTGLAIGAGVVGLAIGAAIASDRGRYYDRGGYYNRGGYGGGYYDRGGYDRGYYGRSHRGYRGRDCYTRKVYDPYYGRRVRVRYCD